MTSLTSTTSIRLITYNCVQIWIYGNAIYIYIYIYMTSLMTCTYWWSVT
jgi:hypothetical protein